MDKVKNTRRIFLFFLPIFLAVGFLGMPQTSKATVNLGNCYRYPALNDPWCPVNFPRVVDQCNHSAGYTCNASDCVDDQSYIIACCVNANDCSQHNDSYVPGRQVCQCVYTAPTPTPTPTPTLDVSLAVAQSDTNYANSWTGDAPLNNIDLKAVVSGTATGNIRYRIWCDQSQGVTHDHSGQTSTTHKDVNLCDYPTPGTYTAKVLVDRDGLQKTDTVAITVNGPPTVELKLSTTSNNWQGSLTLPAPIAKIVDLRATVTNGSGNIDYYFWCNENDATLDFNNYDARKLGTNTNPWKEDNLCGDTYTTPGTYYPKVVIERNGIKDENRKPITVSGTLGATLLVNPPGPGITAFSTILIGGATGTQTGTINYSLWWNCTNTTTSVQDANNDPACGTLATPPVGTCLATAGVGYKCDAITTNPKDAPAHVYTTGATPTTYKAKVIVERGNAPNAQKQVDITVNPNSPPSVVNAIATQPDYCFSGPGAFINWTYVDPDNVPPGTDPQSAYQVQVDNNSNFSSPEVDTGKLIESSTTYFTPVPNFNTTYYVRVKVWDSHDAPSTNWSPTFSFTTPIHAFPWPNFTWSTPTKVGKPITFTNTTTLAPSSTNQLWGWFFCTIGQCTVLTSTQQNPPVNRYLMSNPSPGFPVQLTVTDDAGTCSKTNNVPVGGQFPIWREIGPY